ncbi:MAG: hypothetical protein KTR15_00275 [Phycisphaeraceae bacterium]|nr:hypothetical protein [Phycisphaeraceae bacterium]
MRLTITITLFLLACLMLTPSSLADQDAPPVLPEGAIVFSKPKAALYDKLLVIDENDYSGGGSEVKSDKHRFLHLRVVINYKLPEDTDSISVGSEDIYLVQDGGKKHPSVGSYDGNKVFSDWAKGFWLHSGRNRRNEMVDIVYAIPADATGPFALVVGDYKTLRVELPKGVTEPPHPADMVDVEVKSVAWGDSVPGETIRVGKQEIKTTFSVPGRRLLAVSMLAHALDYNDSNGKQLNWTDKPLSLRDKQGNLYACHGSFVNGRINHNMMHSSEVGKKSTSTKTLFFSPPDDIESFEVLWHGRPVASYTVKNNR